MIIKFEHYVHSDKDSWYEDVRDALEDAGLPADHVETLLQNSSFPFYEIGFDCELDTDNGVVTYKEKGKSW